MASSSEARRIAARFGESLGGRRSWARGEWTHANPWVRGEGPLPSWAVPLGRQVMMVIPALRGLDTLLMLAEVAQEMRLSAASTEQPGGWQLNGGTVVCDSGHPITVGWRNNPAWICGTRVNKGLGTVPAPTGPSLYWMGMGEKSSGVPNPSIMEVVFHVNYAAAPGSYPTFSAARPVQRTIPRSAGISPLWRASQVANRIGFPLSASGSTVATRGSEARRIREAKKALGRRVVLSPNNPWRKARERPRYVYPPGTPWGPGVIESPGIIRHPGGLVRRGPPHLWQRPRPRTKEKKLKVSGPVWRAFAFLMSAFTETGDFIEGIWKALPRSERRAGLTATGNRRIDSMLKDIARGWDKIDWVEAAYNLAENQIEDTVIGQWQKAMNSISRASGPGLGTTLTKMAEHGGVNPYEWLSSALGDIRSSARNAGILGPER